MTSPRPRTPSWVSYLFGYARPYRAGMLGLGAAMFAQALVTMMMPWPMAVAVDYILAERPLPTWAQWFADATGSSSMFSELILAGTALVVLAVVNGGLRVLVRVWRRSLGRRMSNDVSADALVVIQRQSPAASTPVPAGDLIQRVVVDSGSVETLVLGVAMTAFGSLVTLALLGAVVASFSGSAVLIGVLVAVGMALVARWFHQRMLRDALRLARADAALSTVTDQMLTSLPEIQAFCAEDAELARFAVEADAKVAATMRVERATLGFRSSIGTLTGLGTGAVIAVGGLSVLDGAWTVGELLVVLSYLATLFGPIEDLANLARDTASARSGAERLLELATVVEPVPEPDQPVRPPARAPGSSIRLVDVTFGYTADRPVLEGIDLSIEPGELVGIVGPSGTGKSTLVGLIPRFFDPWSGSVVVDGCDVRTLSTRDLRRRIAVVRQEPLLLAVSVRENIAYGSDDVAEEQVRRAAEHALAAEFIEDLPLGYDTVLAERGRTLSGGQRQRLAIARALCREAPILLLDEPTAGLDAESEAELLRLVAASAPERTVVMVTHRLSSLRGADRIVVLDGTHIAEQGTHGELLELDGVYRRYHELQSMRPDARPLLPVPVMARQGPTLRRWHHAVDRAIGGLSRWRPS